MFSSPSAIGDHLSFFGHNVAAEAGGPPVNRGSFGTTLRNGRNAGVPPREQIAQSLDSDYLHAQAHLYSFVHGNLSEIEQYVHALEFSNKQMKERLIEQLKPTLFSFFMGQDRGLKVAIFSIWKRHADIEHIIHLKERHVQETRTVHQENQELMEQAQRRLREARQQNADYEEQLREASSYADELDVEKQNGNGRLNVLRAQLAEADRTLKLLKKNALGSLDGARHEVHRFDQNLKKFKHNESMGENFEQLHPGDRQTKEKSKPQHREEISTIKAQLDQLAKHVYSEQTHHSNQQMQQQGWDWPHDEVVMSGDEDGPASKSTLSPGAVAVRRTNPPVIPLRKQPPMGVDPMYASMRMVPPGGSFGVPPSSVASPQAAVQSHPMHKNSWPTSTGSIPPLSLNSP